MALDIQMRRVGRAGRATGLVLRLAALSGTVLLCCGAAGPRAVGTSVPAKSRTPKQIVALSPWEQAERGRETLNAIPDANRKPPDYTRAMERYRAIYHANPGDVHAPAAV